MSNSNGSTSFRNSSSDESESSNSNSNKNTFKSSIITSNNKKTTITRHNPNSITTTIILNRIHKISIRRPLRTIAIPRTLLSTLANLKDRTHPDYPASNPGTRSKTPFLP